MNGTASPSRMKELIDTPHYARLVEIFLRDGFPDPGDLHWERMLLGDATDQTFTQLASSYRRLRQPRGVHRLKHNEAMLIIALADLYRTAFHRGLVFGRDP